MKKLIIYLLSTYVLLGSSITLVTDSYKPYTDQKMLNGGFFTEIAVEAFEISGVKADVVFVPWSRATELSKLGHYDGLLGAFWTSKRENDFYFSSPIFLDRVLIYSLKGKDKKINNIAELAGSRIGVVRDYFYGKDFDKSSVFKRSISNNSEDNLAQLINNRVDYIVESELVINYLLNSQLIDEKDKVEVVGEVSSDWLYLLFPKSLDTSLNHKELFDSGLEKLKENGSFYEILVKHNIN